MSSTKRDQVLKAAVRVMESDVAWHEAVQALDELLDEIASTPTPVPDPPKEPADEQRERRPSAPTNSLDPHSPKDKIMKQMNAHPERVFSPADFVNQKSNKLTRPQIYNALSSLTRQGHIERVAPGAYKLVA